MIIKDIHNRWGNVKAKYSHLPVPDKPGELVSIPSNPDDLIDEELDRCLISFGSWRGYVSYQLSFIEAQLVIFEEVYALRLGAKVAELEENAPKKMLKESLQGKAIMENEDLMELQMQVSKLRTEKTLLTKQFIFYDGQFETISRIITRRGQEKVRV